MKTTGAPTPSFDEFPPIDVLCAIAIAVWVVAAINIRAGLVDSPVRFVGARICVFSGTIIDLVLLEIARDTRIFGAGQTREHDYLRLWLSTAFAVSGTSLLFSFACNMITIYSMCRREPGEPVSQPEPPDSPGMILPFDAWA